MDSKSISTLELPKILARLADFAAFSASQALALALMPTSELEMAQARQAETTEARKLLSQRSDLTIGGAHDVRPFVRQAARGAVLEPAHLLDIKSTLIASRNLVRTFERLTDPYPRLSAIVSRLEPCPGVVDAISRTLDEHGEVLDSASDRLAIIRRDLRAARERLTGRLQRLLADPKVQSLLQEPIITQREGRFVVPLRAEFKGKLKAVVHDQSASGATLFVEPLTIVDLNNQVRELELAERDEIRRVLTALCAQVGEQAEPIVRTVEAIADLDLALAKARYADALRASEPILHDIHPGQCSRPGSVLRLLSARHPLLDPASVVAIDLTLRPEVHALVITGPNTGGKTVTLKTAGLLALMAQCGLHIPATSGSELSVFDAVYADIGDEQSIEQSLSTFSSHITNTVRIFQAATARSLVVLDELGAGTDPQEGSALARAILQAFLDLPVTVLVATHYPELKTFAHSTPGVSNASVEFDLETLRPTYHLTVGLPGRSNALSIAERLGLPSEIVAQARTLVSPDDLRAEGLLDEIHRQRDAARKARAEAEQARDEAQTLKEELARRLEGIDDERRQVLEEAGHEAGRELEALSQEVQTLRRKLAAARQPLDEIRAAALDLEALQERTAEAIAGGESGPQGEPLSVQPGDAVRLHTLGTEGVVTSVGPEEAEVRIGRLRVRARLDDLAPGGAASAQEASGSRRRKGSTRDQVAQTQRVTPLLSAPPLEIDLRGRQADEALDEMERRLDAAYLAGMPWVRVIHGKGTGRLRQVLRRAMKDLPYVASFEPGLEGEGGEGVTVVRLKSA